MVVFTGCTCMDSRHDIPVRPERYNGKDLPNLLINVKSGIDPFYLWDENLGSFAAVWSENDEHVKVAILRDSGLRKGDVASLKKFEVDHSYPEEFACVYMIKMVDVSNFSSRFIRVFFNKEISNWFFECRYS